MIETPYPTMEALLIGGPAHGRRQAVEIDRDGDPPSLIQILSARVPRAGWRGPEAPPTEVPVDRVFYEWIESPANVAVPPGTLIYVSPDLVETAREGGPILTPLPS